MTVRAKSPLWLFASDATAQQVIPTLKEKKIVVWHCSPLLINPIEGDFLWKAMPSRVVFISANAIIHGLPKLLLQLENVPKANRPSVWVMGKSGQERLLEYFPECQSADAGNDTEALLADPEWLDVQGTSVLIINGKGGREAIAPALIKRGALVERWTVYTREPNIQVSHEIHKQWFNQPPKSLMVLSRESLQRVNQGICTLPKAIQEQIKSLPIYLHHWRIRDLALECGFEVVCESSGLMSLLAEITLEKH